MQGDFKLVRCPACHYEVAAQPAEYGRQVPCPQCGRLLATNRGRDFRVPRIPEPSEADE